MQECAFSDYSNLGTAAPKQIELAEIPPIGNFVTELCLDNNRLTKLHNLPATLIKLTCKNNKYFNAHK